MELWIKSAKFRGFGGILGKTDKKLITDFESGANILVKN